MKGTGGVVDGCGWEWMEDFGVLIRDVGADLGLSFQVVSTATVYFQRTFAVQSVLATDPWAIAAASIFLASKVCECCVRLRGLLSLIELCRRKAAAFDPQSAKTFPVDRNAEEARGENATPVSEDENVEVADTVFHLLADYWKRREFVRLSEELVLRSIGFNFGVPRYFTSLAELLIVANADNKLATCAASTLSDAMICPELTMQYSPLELAASSLLFADACLHQSDISQYVDRTDPPVPHELYITAAFDSTASAPPDAIAPPRMPTPDIRKINDSCIVRTQQTTSGIGPSSDASQPFRGAEAQRQLDLETAGQRRWTLMARILAAAPTDEATRGVGMLRGAVDLCGANDEGIRLLCPPPEWRKLRKQRSPRPTTAKLLVHDKSDRSSSGCIRGSSGDVSGEADREGDDERGRSEVPFISTSGCSDVEDSERKQCEIICAIADLYSRRRGVSPLTGLAGFATKDYSSSTPRSG